MAKLQVKLCEGPYYQCTEENENKVFSARGVFSILILLQIFALQLLFDFIAEEDKMRGRREEMIGLNQQHQLIVIAIDRAIRLWSVFNATPIGGSGSRDRCDRESPTKSYFVPLIGLPS